LTRHDFESILAGYDLGAYTHAEAVEQGTVQTNYFLNTKQRRFVLRYYEVRSLESILFESDLLLYLKQRNFPCPGQLMNLQGAYVGVFQDKPYILFEFMDGQHVEHPSLNQFQQLIQKAAELQELTKEFNSAYISYRWNYTPDLCLQLAREEAERINSQDSRRKLAWLARQLDRLDLPESLPTGICHCDFHFSNVLFKGDELVALLDFDDANYTYLQFDLVGLMEYGAWPNTRDLLDLVAAREVVQEYMKHRPLALIEQKHLFDVYQLSILYDCVWYFGRGSVDDFRERRKIEALESLGRSMLVDALFHG
jgi:Ser/Thr protein kinase RdoA (MazF antagonist)